jgi:hypothetical protein
MTLLAAFRFARLPRLIRQYLIVWLCVVCKSKKSDLSGQVL